jgi:SAM-dependent methyltransferase
MDEREEFYRSVLNLRIKDKQASILVCGGGSFDKTVLESAGYTNVVISNLDERMTGDEYAPFGWKYENAESLSFDNESFDYVVIHAAVHHASSPHKVLTEMYRVALKGILVIESRDSFVMRLFEKLKFVQTYEHAAVFYNDCRYGGVNNTDIPNYIYRWSERDVEKTINVYAPYADHNFFYSYSTAFPCTPDLEKKGILKYVFLQLAKPFYWLFVKLFPSQQNLFCFYIEKPLLPDALFPWLIFNDGKIAFNREWASEKYKTQNPSPIDR